MRSFPRTPGRRVPTGGRRALSALVVGLLAVALTAGVLGGPDAARADELKDKKREVQGQIKAASGQLVEASARAQRTAQALESAQTRLVAARGELSVARARVGAAKVRDQEMQDRLESAIVRLKAARGSLKAGRRDVVVQRTEVGAMVLEAYTSGDPQLNALTGILDSQTPSDLAASVEAQHVLVSTQNNVYDQLRATEVLLDVRAQQVREAKQQTADRRREAARQLEQTRVAETAAENAEAAVSASLVDSRVARTRAVSARRADLAKLRALKAEQVKIEALLARRAEAARNPEGPTGGYLSYPTSGGVTSPFGYRIHPIYGYWGLHDGIDFGAGCGSPLRAGASGKVLSAYYSSVYGNRMILDHGLVRGVGLATIFNHASSYTVSVGQQVSRGQVIGYVGDTGWSTGCHLHFTVMVNGKAVNPMGWL